MKPACCAALVSLVSLSCGYHVSGRADTVPKHIGTVAVTVFGNATTRYKLPDRLANAIAREFISRTRYKVVNDVNAADAVLEGTIVSFNAYPIASDPATARATAVQMNVVLQVTLRERATGKALFSRPYYEVKERYEIALDQRAYFEESDTAAERLSRDAARSIVSAILEGF